MNGALGAGDGGGGTKGAGAGEGPELQALRHRLAQLPPLRDVISAAGFGAKRSLGQHFLLDRNLTEKIAATARPSCADPDAPLLGMNILEIGPGPGGLTRSLLHAGARVVAVEKDARAAEVLAPLVAAASGRLTLHIADALSVNWQSLVPPGTTICANLPYNVATPLITGWLTTDPWPPWWASATVMVQKEVATRMVASAGEGAYGRLSVLTAARTHATAAFDIAPTAFVPPPKVFSTVVRLDPRPEAADVPTNALEKVTAAAFGQRRKMLRSSLKGLGDAEGLLAGAGIAPTERAERIPVAGFLALASLLDERQM